MQKQPDDAQKEQLGDLVDNIEKKWSSLHVTVNDYKDSLDRLGAYYKLFEEVELWLSQKSQLIKQLNTYKTELKYDIKNSDEINNSLKRVDLILTQVDDAIDECKHVEEKAKQLSEIAVQITGTYLDLLQN